MKEARLFRIIHHAASYHLIRPGLDFFWRSFCPVGLQPCSDHIIRFCGLNGGFELLAIDAFETEEHVIQRAIVMIFAGRSRQAGAAFVNRAFGNGKAGETGARAMRGLFGQIAVNDGCVHKWDLSRWIVLEIYFRFQLWAW